MGCVEILKGREYPLGATVVDGGVNFALYSRNASAVHLLLFDEPNGEPTDTIQLQDRVGHADAARRRRVRPDAGRQQQRVPSG